MTKEYWRLNKNPSPSIDREEAGNQKNEIKRSYLTSLSLRANL